MKERKIWVLWEGVTDNEIAACDSIEPLKAIVETRLPSYAEWNGEWFQDGDDWVREYTIGDRYKEHYNFIILHIPYLDS